MSDFKLLRKVPFLTGMAENLLMELGAGVDEVTLKPGEVLFTEGEPATSIFYLLDGEFEAVKRVHDGGEVRSTIAVGDLPGQIVIMTGAHYPVTLRATQPSRAISFASSAMKHLFNATAEMVARHLEKLAALGKIAAGLAHELNNPAAAARRASEQMGPTLATMYRVGLNLQRHTLSAEQRDYLDSLQQEIARRGAQPSELSPVEESDREEALIAWMESCGVSNGWQFATHFVHAGLTEEELASIAARVPREALADALAWISGTITMGQLQREVEQSTASIHDLVTAIKAYSRMDQSLVKDVDIHDGIEHTLVILNHKLKQGMTVVREYDRSLPHIEVFGNELNQVWTNLIDNAIDATEGRGQVTIRTSRHDDGILVEIADNGTGITPEDECRIFEPFFTTKGQGKGIGLGLNIAWRIVTERYGGDMYFHSVPGNTRFWVRVPIKQASQKAGAQPPRVAEAAGVATPDGRPLGSVPMPEPALGE
jgi:signal transduction histidine kinase